MKNRKCGNVTCHCKKTRLAYGLNTLLKTQAYPKRLQDFSENVTRYCFTVEPGPETG